MCRLLCVKADNEFEIAPHLEAFAELSKNSTEYQGHGWGCAYLVGGEWKTYRNITPIWEDDLIQFGRTALLLAHARSAYKDEGIVVENNMPFSHGAYQFIFNGELRGVRIKERGRIGAEKIFNYVRRFGDGIDALRRAVTVIKKRSAYVRAMNFLMADTEHVYLVTTYSEQPEYFQMWEKQGEPRIVCSDPYPGEEWTRIENNTVVHI